MEKNFFDILRNVKINVVSKVKFFFLLYLKYNKNGKIINRYGFFNCMFFNLLDKNYYLYIIF